jgi:hypothetical protein
MPITADKPSEKGSFTNDYERLILKLAFNYSLIMKTGQNVRNTDCTSQKLQKRTIFLMWNLYDRNQLRTINQQMPKHLL